MTIQNLDEAITFGIEWEKRLMFKAQTLKNLLNAGSYLAEVNAKIELLIQENHNRNEKNEEKIQSLIQNHSQKN